MISAVFVMSGLGLSAGICLVIAWQFFNVEEDPDLKRILDALPGSNCGACGYIGCQDAAKAILKGKASINVCAAGGFETMSRLSDILKIPPAFNGPISAVSGCTGGARVENRFYYKGIKNCRAEYLFYGGSKICENGCLGHGSCCDACMFDAIFLSSSGGPEIIDDKCRGCGKCVEICPKGVLSIVGLAEKLIHLNRVDDCLSPCRQKCPAQIDIPRMVRQICAREYSKALLTIKEKNPLPLSIGRVCAHPCENICRRNIADQGVAISQLGRFLSDRALKKIAREPLACLPDTGRRVAVVGGGPAGLSCAYFLRRLGHAPVIFEKKNKLGGMLRYTIPEYRLPKKLVDEDIQGILELGIKVETGVTLGRHFSLNELKARGFEAIFLGLGAWHIPALCVDGEYLGNVIKSLDFLARVGEEIKDLSGTCVAVIGESNTAMDCARSCIRLNAQSVTIVCPVEQKEMSARKRDVSRAMEEGVAFLFLTTPIRILPDQNYNAFSLEYCSVLPVSKKNRAVIGEKIKGSEKTIRADLIISAYERKPDIEFLFNGQEELYQFKASANSTLAADRSTLMASSPDIFTAGDLYTGRASVVEAVAGGRIAARSIHLYLTLGEIPISLNTQKRINPKSIIKNVSVSTSIPKVIVKEKNVEIRKKSFEEEVLGTISREQALIEAGRCLRCGTFCND